LIRDEFLGALLIKFPEEALKKPKNKKKHVPEEQLALYEYCKNG
jgi:hypothetical protein